MRQSLGQFILEVAANGPEAVHAEIANLNGGWALVVAWPTGEVLAAVDRMRTVPLFFYHNDDDFAIAASGTELARRFSRAMNICGQLKFLLFTYVSGPETLYDGVQQIQPGEIIHYRPGRSDRLQATRYFRFYPPASGLDHGQDLEEGLANVIQRMFERLRDGFRGKRVVVPLSGGLDSRLVAGMLKRVGVDNCVCFSYGDESSQEVQISRQVAESLGFRWRFTPYSPQLWARWNNSEVFREHWRYACKGVSKPCLQDFPAVMQLAEEGFQGDETVFFPGHTGDMISGGHIPPDYEDLHDGTLGVTDEIIRHHARPLWYEPSHMFKTPAGQCVLDRLRQEAAPPAGAGHENRVACCDMWDAEQRQAKYIINSVRTYESVGSQWRTLWDYDFMDFFLRVPVELRYGERLYLDCLRKRIFVDDLAPLAEIPVTGRGRFKSLTSTRRPAKRTSLLVRQRNFIRRKIRWQLLKAGIMTPGIRDVHPWIDTVARLNGLGITDGSDSFSEVLDRIGALSSLPPEIQQALQPWLKMKVHNMRWLSVFATIALAEMSRHVHS